jgi:hypothetical protein
LLGKLSGTGVVETEKGDMGDLVELGAEGGIEIGVVVAVDIGPDGGVAVEVAAALGIPEPATLTASDVDAWVVQVLPHLGERVPSVPPVGGIQSVGGRRDR